MPRLSRRPRLRAILAALPVVFIAGALATQARAQDTAVLEIDRTMENYRLDAHIPGMVWGIVQDGKLVHVKAAGVQEIETKRPVTADTLFRIASMSKAFTALSILKLRDEGKLSLDAPPKPTSRSCVAGNIRPRTRRRFECVSC